MPSVTLAASSEELAQATKIRRELHRIPELGYQEFKTAELIRHELHRLRIDFTPGPPDAPTATIALIGDPTKPCIALRADIDALPISEQTGVEYTSTHPGKMHACGHDGHAANLLATASMLRSLVTPLNVCVKLLFQPAEEGGGGAARLVRAGVLDDTPTYGPKVRRIFGLHGYPPLPVGVVATKSGPFMASTDALHVTVRGVGCHGAFPHLGRDPIVAAAELVMSLQSFVTREIDPVEPAVVTVGVLHAGTASNIIPDTAHLEATVRTLTDASREKARTALIRRATAIAEANACTAEINYIEGYPAVINDLAAADLVAAVAREQLGPTRYIPAAAPVMGGEDFAYYLEKTPGAFFFVGVRPPELATFPPLHSDRFDFEDTMLATGTAMFAGLVQAFAQGR